MGKAARTFLWVAIGFLLGLGVGIANPSTGNQQLPSNCDFIHWQTDTHMGKAPAKPFDANRDNRIDCRSEVK